MRIGWVIAGVLGLAACSSELSTPMATTTGEGPCSAGEPGACSTCVANATGDCEANQCSSEAATLRACASATTSFSACTDAGGNPTSECCRVEEDALKKCFDACPAMQRCG